jgi:hypothetical protein
MYRRRVWGCFAASTLALTAFAQGTTQSAAPANHSAAKRSAYANTAHSEQVDQYYGSLWGIDHLQVQRTSSGALVRFSYRVVDAKKAEAVRDKKAEPHLIELRSHAMLSVPTLENVGTLRQTEAVENGKEYWVLFSNKGDYVKVGSRVDVIIGDFYASGLIVR